jgi:citrate lyase subunit beta/citryl-CoA lyase
VALRSIVAIPVSGSGLEEALASAADAVLLTLADDSRPVGTLRLEAIGALGRISEAGKAGMVIVNHPRTRLLRDDLDAIVSPLLKAVVLPHALEPQDVRDMAVLLREFELNRGIEPGEISVFPMIDTARGLLRAAEIAQAAPRVGGLVFGSYGYARDISARYEQRGPRLSHARGAVVAASRASDQHPLVVADGLELLHLAQYGFAGAILPDAGGVVAANMAFTPSAAALERARRHASAYDAARGEGAWVARSGAEIVDSHAARKARRLLD